MTPINNNSMVNQNGYVDSDYLKATTGIFTEIKHKSYDLMGVCAGHNVLDVGCGIGVDTLNMAKLIGQKGAVIGVDFDRSMVKKANERANDAFCSDWVKHLHADAYDLPFNAYQFSAVRCERLFEHLPDPDKALSEMIRVAQFAGRIVVVDTDWATLSIHTDLPDIERKLNQYAATRHYQNGCSGRRLYGLFKAHQLKNICVHIFPIATSSYDMASMGIQLQRMEDGAVKAGVLTDTELQQWRDSNARLSDAGQFFASINIVMLAGCKTNN